MAFYVTGFVAQGKNKQTNKHTKQPKDWFRYLGHNTRDYINTNQP